MLRQMERSAMHLLAKRGKSVRQHPEDSLCQALR